MVTTSSNPIKSHQAGYKVYALANHIGIQSNALWEDGKRSDVEVRLGKRERDGGIRAALYRC